jgi:hypothetical protein
MTKQCVIDFIGVPHRMQHFAQNKEDFGGFLQNPHVTCFVIRIRKRRTIVSFYNNRVKPKISHKCK